MQEEYLPEQLYKIQQLELEILKDFIKICEENDLEYFFGGGSAIGVVRHHGFIPWDDDIDVSMDRKNYDKFLQLSKDVLTDKYYILNHETNGDYPCMNTHICLKGTKFITEDIKDFKGESGIFLDLFCFDNIPDDDKLMRKQGTRAWFWGKLMILSRISEPVLYYYGIKRKILRFVLKFAHYFLNVIGLNQEFCYKKAKKYSTMYNNQQTKRMAFMFDPSRFTSIMEKDDVYPLRKMKFEDIEVCVPNKVEKYLQNRFGDYMTLPPKEQRHNHKPYILDFGKYK